MTSDPPRAPSDPPRSTRDPKAQPPDSFARLFLQGLAKYDSTQMRAVGTATEEAAANLAAKAQPKQRAMAGLELRSPRAILETAAITLAFPLLGLVVDPTDPFFLNTRFAWILFAPLLVSLRHGFTLGFGSAVALDAMILASWRFALVPFEKFPAAPLVGLVALAMVAGQFSDVWKREIVRLDSGFTVLRRQVNELERSRFLLELSHDRLDAQVGKQVNSLREAMAAVRDLAKTEDKPTFASMGEAIVEVYAAYCMLEVGELYVVDRGRLGARVAALGRPEPLEPDDPLVERALQKGQLTFLPAASNPDRDPTLARSKLLAAVPFVDITGRVDAMLTVQSMPFIAFEKKNLEAMASLAGYFADLIAQDGLASDAERARKEIFRVRVLRALRDVKEMSLPSVVACLWIQRGAPVSDLVEVLLGGALRELEFPYVTRDARGNHLVYVLLPMADETAARALRARFEATVQRNLHVTLDAAGASYTFHVLEPTDFVDDIFRRFERKAQQHETHLESGRIL